MLLYIESRVKFQIKYINDTQKECGVIKYGKSAGIAMA